MSECWNFNFYHELLLLVEAQKCIINNFLKNSEVKHLSSYLNKLRKDQVSSGERTLL